MSPPVRTASSPLFFFPAVGCSLSCVDELHLLVFVLLLLRTLYKYYDHSCLSFRRPSSMNPGASKRLSVRIRLSSPTLRACQRLAPGKRARWLNDEFVLSVGISRAYLFYKYLTAVACVMRHRSAIKLQDPNRIVYTMRSAATKYRCMTQCLTHHPPSSGYSAASPTTGISLPDHSAWVPPP